MKKILIAISCGAALFFGSCKEVPPTINFRTASATDTSYVLPAASVPAAQPHNVLIEEFTGEGCSNCPAAHSHLDDLVSANPGRVNVVSLYQSSSAPICVPPAGASYDLRDSAASDILHSIIYTTNQDANYGNLPAGGVDRVPVTPGTTTYLGSSSWDGLVASRLAVSDSLNLDISSTFDASSRTATITAKITYLQPTSSLQNLTIVVVEDSIVDYQEFPFGAVHTDYVFNDVFVGMATAGPFGDPVLSTTTTKEAGRVYQRKYTYTVPNSFQSGIVYPSHCRVIAFVNRPSNANADFQVMQSQQTKLVP